MTTHFTHSEEPELISIQDITDQEWQVIKDLAVGIHDEGCWGGDALKIYVNAFTLWLHANNKSFMVEVPKKESVH